MTVVDVAAAGRNQVPLGIAYMVGSTVMFAGGNAVVKWQLASYPLGEVAFGRTLFAFLTAAAIVLPRAGWGVLRTQRYREHFQRGLSQFGSMLCWFLAVSVLSLGSATAIGFAAPLFTTLLSIVILKEKVGIHRWSALIVGFVGVLIITHPGTRHADLRRAVRARQRSLNLDRGDRDPAHEHDRIDRDTDALPDEHYDLVHRRPAHVRVPSPTLGRRGDGFTCRGRQRNCPVLVDALAFIGAALGSGAVQLPFAGMGNDPRLRDLGGRADPGPAGRFRNRSRLGPSHPVARDLTPPTPAVPAPQRG